jgi:cobalt-zinc-cadmium efflux system protein
VGVTHSDRPVAVPHGGHRRPGAHAHGAHTHERSTSDNGSRSPDAHGCQDDEAHPDDDHGHDDPGHHDHRHHGGAHGHGGHEHGHGGHSHAPSANADARLLGAALALIVSFLLAEVVVGLLARSVALLSDAAHMLTDAASLVLALVAMRLARRPAAGPLTYGWRRIEILAAQANGFALLALALVLGIQAVERLVHPSRVAGLPVLATALAGVLVNIGATALLARADRRSLNVEGAFQHVLTDLFAFLATAAAGLVIVLTGFTRADPLAALAVAALMTRAGVGLVRDTGRVFMEAAPVGVNPAEIGAALTTIDEVADVHDLHVWEVMPGLPALSAHLLVNPAGDCHRVQDTARILLRERWGIRHVTLQVDHAEPTLLTITRGPRWQCSVDTGQAPDRSVPSAGHREQREA